MTKRSHDYSSLRLLESPDLLKSNANSNSNVNGVAGNVIMAHDVSVTHLQMIEEFLSNEEAYISQFLSVISQVSSK